MKLLRYEWFPGNGQPCSGKMRKMPDELILATAEDIGAASDMIEAELIALLAARYLAQLPSTWPETTGASAAQIAGMRADPL